MVAAGDEPFMDRALFLAERGRGRTSPNPVVGAVVVSPDGVVVGQGAHLELGGPHAEVAALDAAGPRARGATLYCTLEPCVHHGRTGPCVERIAAAGVARVVAAMRDPNPLVNGAGVAFLRARGIDVLLGVRAEAAARQNAPFLSWIGRRRPFVTIKTATSADGFVGRAGERVHLTGATAGRLFHRQRAAIDAIAVGSGTAVADDPVLTARGAYRHRPLTRVIFDWRLRVPASARVFSTVAAGPVIMVVSAGAARDRPAVVAGFTARGAEVESVPPHDLAGALARLAARGITWLLVEGGPTLHAAFCRAGLVDQVQWVLSPRMLGRGIAAGDAVADLAESAAELRRTTLGGDTLIEFDVHRTDRSDGPDGAR
jgi:diaminohydroxyphosphoribosylaminopyrimidine deaminase/5-amino-6-(5-phosphoribosylamino)uracil reductase